MTRNDILWKPTLWVVLMALLLRVAIVLYCVPRDTLAGDPGEYLQKGQSWAETGLYGAPPEEFRMPGMPALVALGYWGWGQAGVRYFTPLLFAVLSVIAVTAMCHALCRQWPVRQRAVALLLAQFTVLEFLLPVFRILPDLPAMNLAIIATSALVVWGRAYPFAAAAFAGLALAIACFLRPDYILVALSISAAFVCAYRHTLGTRKAAAPAGVLLICVCAPLVLWGIRNQQITGRFRVFSNHGAQQLWYGFHEGAGLQWKLQRGPWATAPAEERGKIALGVALEWMMAHPDKVAFLGGSRLISHLMPAPPTIVSQSVRYIPNQQIRRAARVAVMIIFEMWLLAGITALILSARGTLPPPLTFLAATVIARLPIAFMAPEEGRFLLVLGPFLAFTAIWFFHQPGRPPAARILRTALTLFVSLMPLRVAFGLYWGWHEVLRAFL